MDFSNNNASTAPVLKVGAVVLREDGAEPQVLLIQPKPKPKTPDDLPPLGLPRGTRMYRDASGQMVDANHDGSTLPEAGAVFEPVHDTLAREAEEEVGLSAPMLAAAEVMDLGAHRFASRKKQPYPIHWFLLRLPDVVAQHLPLTGMQDSLHSLWVTLAELKALVEEKKASAGYVTVVEMALEHLS